MSEFPDSATCNHTFEEVRYEIGNDFTVITEVCIFCFREQDKFLLGAEVPNFTIWTVETRDLYYPDNSDPESNLPPVGENMWRNDDV